MWSYIAGGVFLALAIYFIVQGIRCGAAVRKSKNRLAAYNAQAAAYVELLDKLGIDKVHLLATSAGGSVAIRFALDYPQRTKGLILYCSAMPPVEKPEKYAEYAGPPPFLCNDYVMFLLSPMFEPIMGMEPSTIYSMLPVSDRKDGVVLDASITNPDMARNFEDYTVEGRFPR